MKNDATLYVLIMLAVLIFSPKSLFAGEILEGYLAEAMNSNSDIAAAKRNLLASEEKIRQSGVLPDPTLGLDYFIEPIETRTGAQEAALSISQKLPWPGKLRLAKDIAGRQRAVLQRQLSAVELRVTRKVKQSYVNYALNREEIQVLRENLELLKYMEKVARSRYTAGKLGYSNLLKIQIEMAKSAEKLKTATDRSQSLKSRLNSVLGGDTVSALPEPILPDVTLHESVKNIIAASLRNNPDVLEIKERISVFEYSKGLAAKEFYPDFSFSLKTILTDTAEFGNPPDSGDDPVIASVKVNIPLFRDRRHGSVAEKEALINALQFSLLQKTRDLHADIEQGVFRYKNAQRSITLYEDILLPTVEQEFEVALEAFKGDRLTVLELIDTEKNLLSFHLEGIRAKADRALAVAELETLAGRVSVATWN